MSDSIKIDTLGLDASKASKNGWERVVKAVWQGGVVCALLVAVTIYYIDLPLATFLHQSKIDQIRWIRGFLDLPILLTPLAMLYMLLYGLRYAKMKSNRHYHACFVISSTLLIACQVKNILKIAFGRTWPRDVSGRDVDLILSRFSTGGFVNDGIHAFHPFAGTKAFTSFPSGTTCALMASLSQLGFTIPFYGLYWHLYLFLLSCH